MSEDQLKLLATVVGGIFGLVGTVITLLAVFPNEWLKHRLARGLSKYAAEIEREKVTSAFRDPLLHAAYDLQSRIYNIVRGNFLKAYYTSGTDKEKQYATENTLFLIAQYSPSPRRAMG